MSTIGEINRQIVKLIGQSASPTILGLLPVEVKMQDECLGDVRTHVAGDFHRLSVYFGYFPAATAYAVALSIGRGVMDANFYNAITKQKNRSVFIYDILRNALSCLSLIQFNKN